MVDSDGHNCVELSKFHPEIMTQWSKTVKQMFKNSKKQMKIPQQSEMRSGFRKSDRTKSNLCEMALVKQMERLSVENVMS